MSFKSLIHRPFAAAFAARRAVSLVSHAALLVGATAALLLAPQAQAAITASKTFVPGSWSGTGAPPAPISAPVNQGDIVWLNIAVLNNSGAVVTGLAGTDPLPIGITLAPVPAPGAATGCGTSGSYNATPGASSFSFSGLQIPAAVSGVNGVCDIYVRVRITGPVGSSAGTVATLTNTIPAGNITGSEGGATVAADSAAAQSIQVIRGQDLQTSKAFSPGLVPAGATSTATVVITNPNSAYAVGLSTLTENLPTNLTATAAPMVACSSGGSPTAPTAMGGSFPSLVFPAGTTVAANGTCTVSFNVRAQALAGNSAYYATNTIPWDAVGNDRSVSSRPASNHLLVLTPMRTTKWFNLSTARANTPVALALYFENLSGFAVTAATFTDSLPTVGAGVMRVVAPGGATASASNPPGCSPVTAITAAAGSTTISGTGMTMPAGATCGYSVMVEATDDGVYSNTIPPTTFTSADPNVGATSNGPTSASLTIYDQSTASKTGQDPRDPANLAGGVAPGNRVVYRVAISNYSLSALTDLQVVDPLPLASGAQVTHVSSIAATVTGDFGCSGPTTTGGTAATPIFSGIQVPAGSGAYPATCYLEFTAQVPNNWPAGTDIVNTIPAGNITYGPGGSFTLQGPAVIDQRPYLDRFITAKAVEPATIFQGDTALVSVTLTNNNYSAMTAVQFTDNPLFGAGANVRNANPTNPSTTCGGTPVYTYAAGGSSFAVSGLTIPARSSCVVSWRVMGANPGGPYTNTLPAASVSGTTNSGLGPVSLNAANSASTSLTVNSVLLLNKSFSPNTVAAAGGVSRVSIAMQNVGTLGLTGLAAADPLPAGLTVANPARASSTCSGSPVITANPGASTVSMSNAALPPGTSCLLQFDVVSSVAGASVNTVPAGSVTADGGIFNASPASATLDKLPPKSVNISKAFSPPSLPAVGAVSRLTVNLQNNLPGAIELSNVGFVDAMPAGMVVAATPDVVSSCPGATVSAVAGQNSFAMSGASMPANTVCQVSLSVTLTASGSFVNTLPPGVVTNAQGATNADLFSSTLATLATLGVDKSFSPTSAPPNTPVQLRIRVINSLSNALTQLNLSDPLPAGVVPATPSGLASTCSGANVSVSGGVVSMSNASLPAATASGPSVCEVTLRVLSASNGNYVNTIAAGSVSARAPGGSTASNLAPAVATLRVLQALGVSKAFAEPFRTLNQAHRLTLTVSNPNSVPVNNVALTDNLPAGVFVADTPAQGSTCTNSTVDENGTPIVIPVQVTAAPGASSVRLSGAQIPAGGSCTFYADVLSNRVGTWNNVVPASAITSHEGVTNSAPANASFTTLAPPTLGKAFSPVQIASGGTAQLRIQLGNANAVAITLTQALVDNLPTAPGAMTLGATPIDAAATTCSAASISAAAGGTSITYASGANIAAGGCVIVANVTGTVEGSYNNLIPASGLLTNAGPNPVPAAASLLISSSLSSIAGRVFLDANNDGTQQGGELGISSQLIELVNTATNTVVASQLTNTAGDYAFLGLAPGSYSVRQVSQPAGTLNGITSAGAATPGGSAGTASGLTAAPSVISTIVVAGGQSSVNNNFAEIAPSRIGGKVYLDANNDGTPQASEAPIGSVNITLSGTDDTGAIANINIATAADGSYSFQGLRPGVYTVTEGAQPAGTANGITSASAVLTNGTNTPAPGGSAGAATAPTVTSVASPAGTSRVANITLPPNAAAMDNNFGELPQDRSLRGRVFVDINNDASLNGADAGIGTLTVTVTGTDASGNPVSFSTTTAADGTYAFNSLPPSDATGYTVSYNTTGSPTPVVLGQSLPGIAGGTGASTGTGRTRISGIVLNGPVTVANDNNFTQRPPGEIAGRVFLDTNNNGTYEPSPGGSDQPLQTVALVLTGTDYGPDGVAGGGDDVTLPAVGAPGAITTTTAADGTYRFQNLRPGSYNVVQPTQPSNTANGITTAGSISGTPTGTAGSATGTGTTPSAINGIVLAAGNVSPGNNFAEVALVSITGVVFIDANRNQVLDGTDTGRIGGVTISLVRGADCATGTLIQSTTTAAGTGSYAFNNVPADGGYRICQTQPAGYGNGASIGANGTTAASNEIVIASLPATGLTDQNFGELVATISGAVYQDFTASTPAQTNNGVRDAGEVGIANVPITLTGRDVNGSPVNLSTTTDSSGNYSFTNLLAPNASGYTITEGAIPAASGTFNDGIDSVGNASVAAGSAAVNDVFSGIRVAPGEQASGYNFGELPIAPITGVVYIDSNRNNTLDGTDTLRLPGVALSLYAGNSCSGTALASTTTGNDGSYSFSGHSVGGTFTICQTQPIAYANGNANGVAGSNQITITGLAAIGSANNNFGELAASVAGFVFLDAANNGSKDLADTALVGVNFTLTGRDINGNAVSRTAASDAAGGFLFDDLPAAGAGGYTITQQAVQPVSGGTTTLNGTTTRGTIAGTGAGTATPVASTPSAVSGIALAAGNQSVNNLFAEILPVGISGLVFLDANNNGVQNLPVDTGLANVSVVITGTDDTGAAVNRTLTTNAAGVFSVVDLRPGTYTLTEPTQPAGTSNGQTLAGTVGGTTRGTPSAITTVPSTIAGIALTTPGASSINNFFAEIPTSSSLAGRVFADSNNNGVLDGAEAGLGGVTIELSGTDLGGQAVTRSTTTAADGTYSFTGLPPGTYTVREPNQPVGTVNGRTLAGSTGGTATAVGTVPSAISAITLGVGQASVNNDFAEVPGASISGRVYGDSNNNGVVDASESGFANVSLVLTGTDDVGNAVNITVSTASDGRYSFTNLRPGTYTVTEPTQPVDTINGITSAGTIAGASVGTATARTVVPSAIAAIVLPPAASSIDNNFGEIFNSPDLKVTKTHSPATFTVNNTGRYTLHVRNVGQVPSTGTYTVSDRLPAGLSLTATPTGTGWTCVGAAGATAFSCTSSAVVNANAQSPNPITALVQVAASAATASPVHNAVMVEGGGELEAFAPTAAERAAHAGNPTALPRCTATTGAFDANACHEPTPVQLAASISGTAWFDVGATVNALDASDQRLSNWIVEVLDPATNAVLRNTTTNASGQYSMLDLVPGVPLAVRFRDPVSGVAIGMPVNGETASGSSGASCNQATAIANGSASSCPERGSNARLVVVLRPGQNLPQQSLPVDPNGVVYDSTTRNPVPGSTVTLTPVGTCPAYDPAIHVVNATAGGYTLAGNAISMTVGAIGFYQFWLAPTAPPKCSFALTVTPPAGYTWPSTAIAPQAGELDAPGAAGTAFAVQPQSTAPSAVPGAGTTYYLRLATGSGEPDIVHNHIPLDPAVPARISLSKQADRSRAEIGETVLYTLTVRHLAGSALPMATIRDRLPAGFTYIAGTARVGGAAIAAPSGGLGPVLGFNIGPLAQNATVVLTYRARIGVGALQGDGINIAQAHGCGTPAGCLDPVTALPLTSSVPSNEARAKVLVLGGVFTQEACVAGKIFVDCNGNSVQDSEELGIPGVRLYLSNGSFLVSDSEGKYSQCGLPARGTTIKVDPLTLPRGSRLTTSSNRNLADAGSLWLDLKIGELHRADFIEGSCSNTVLEQVKARRAQGEVRAPETERRRGPALHFDTKPLSAPQQGTDSANQAVVAPRPAGAASAARSGPPRPNGASGRNTETSESEKDVPVGNLPVNANRPATRQGEGRAQ